MSGIPTPMLRSSFQARDPKSHKSVTEMLEIKMRVDAWIDGLIEAGCLPWDADGKNREEVKVGWFPEVEEIPYNSLKTREDSWDCSRPKSRRKTKRG
jgi:hypothetical protein